jgi:hypothetical protein
MEGVNDDRGRSLSRPGQAAAAAPTTASRDRLIALLSDRFADGTLDVDEFERRVTVAHRSDSAAELEALAADLPAAPGAPLPAPAPPPASRALIPEAHVRRSGLVLSIMGGSERKGPWTVPRRLDVVSFMGGARLDLREARMPAGVVDLRVASLMGGVEIIVPPTLAVESNGVAIMGGFEHIDRAPAAPDPSAPLVRISGIAMMGGVKIETRLPGETEREARKRRKRERRALRSAE